MKIRFTVDISTNKTDPNRLDIVIKKPEKVAKKWGALVLLTYCGILKGLQDSYETIDGKVINDDKDNTSKE